MIYVFDNLHAQNLPWSEDDRAIARRLSDQLVSYVTSGDPNPHGTQTLWEPVSAEEPRTFAIGDRWEPFELSTADRIAFVRNYLRDQPAW